MFCAVAPRNDHQRLWTLPPHSTFCQQPMVMRMPSQLPSLQPVPLSPTASSVPHFLLVTSPAAVGGRQSHLNELFQQYRPVTQQFVDVEKTTPSAPADGGSGKRSRPVTSFSIADILKGRVGKRRRRVSPAGGGEDGSRSVKGGRGGETTGNSRNIIRPWNECTRTDNCSRSSTDNNENEECSSEYEEDEDDDEIDVDDAKSSPPTSAKPVCPLGALLRMANQTNFDASGNRLIDCFGDESIGETGSSTEDQLQSRRHLLSGSRCFRACKKRRKTRTAFTNQQIAELERRFGRQKYLTPADRDEIASSLRLSSAQVITWFQNRRAKLKRDLEELKADVTAAKALGNEPSSAVLDRLAELTRSGGLQGSSSQTTAVAAAKKEGKSVGGRGR